MRILGSACDVLSFVACAIWAVWRDGGVYLHLLEVFIIQFLSILETMDLILRHLKNLQTYETHVRTYSTANHVTSTVATEALRGMGRRCGISAFAGDENGVSLAFLPSHKKCSCRFSGVR